MQTVWDWTTILIFAGLITLFLSRSSGEPRQNDSIWHYLVASVGCAITNWFGNEGILLAAVAMLAATLWYIYHFLVRAPQSAG
jgi:hypothetical protein